MKGTYIIIFALLSVSLFVDFYFIFSNMPTKIELFPLGYILSHDSLLEPTSLSYFQLSLIVSLIIAIKGHVLKRLHNLFK